jgi:hypothetical protein
MRTLIILTPDSILDDNGNIWYTLEGYLSYKQLSLASVQLPYKHVSLGIAEKTKIFTTTFFRPLTYDVKR